MAETCELEVRGRILIGASFLDQGLLRVGAGRVLWSGPAERAPRASCRRQLRLAAGWLIPGLIDLHVHGAGGADAAEATPAALQQLRRLHLAGGTVALCPTLVSSPAEATLRALACIKDQTGQPGSDGALVLGAHLEGPFLNPARAGAHPLACLRAPDPVLLEELLAAAGPSLRVMTLAPELPGALPLIARLVERGVLVSLGHSQASHAETMAAVAAGARAVTHVFNAMAPLHHREVGLAGAALASDALVTEVIADGVHLSAPLLQLLWKLKGPDRLVLVTDAVAALQAPPGTARLAGQPIEARDGAARTTDGKLAGSVLTMAGAVHNLVELAGAPLSGAVRAGSETPCRLLGLADRGSLAAGQQADFVVLDQSFRVQAVFLEGELVLGEVSEEPGG